MKFYDIQVQQSPGCSALLKILVLYMPLRPSKMTVINERVSRVSGDEREGVSWNFTFKRSPKYTYEEHSSNGTISTLSCSSFSFCPCSQDYNSLKRSTVKSCRKPCTEPVDDILGLEFNSDDDLIFGGKGVAGTTEQRHDACLKH